MDSRVTGTHFERSEKCGHSRIDVMRYNAKSISPVSDERSEAFPEILEDVIPGKLASESGIAKMYGPQKNMAQPFSLRCS